MSSTIIGVRYIGEDPCPVRSGDRPFANGENITGPEDVVAMLLARGDFEAIHVEIEPPPADAAAPVAPEKE